MKNWQKDCCHARDEIQFIPQSNNLGIRDRSAVSPTLQIKHFGYKVKNFPYFSYSILRMIMFETSHFIEHSLFSYCSVWSRKYRTRWWTHPLVIRTIFYHIERIFDFSNNHLRTNLDKKSTLIFIMNDYFSPYDVEWWRTNAFVIDFPFFIPLRSARTFSYPCLREIDRAERCSASVSQIFVHAEATRETTGF